MAKIPPGGLLGGQTFFLQNVSTHQYEYFSGEKFCSKIKNKKVQNFSDAIGF